ncbi:MAG: HlyD family secretion protein [Chloroflexota bacterium]
MKKLTLILVMLAFLLSACDGTATPVPTSEPVKESSSNVTAEGTLRPAPSVELGFVQGGVIAEVSAQSGQKVSAGQVIARLVGIESARAELAAAQWEQTLAQQSLDALHRNALLTDAEAQQSLHAAQKAYETAEGRWDVGDKEKATDLELALEDYVQAEQDYRDAKKELDRFAYKDKDDSKRQKAQETFDKEKENLAGVHADLLKELPTSDALLDEKQIDLLRAIAALELARQQVDRLDQGLDRETLLAAETHLTAAQAHVQAAEAALELYELRAPFGGVLLRLDLKVGETASPGLPVAFLADISRWTVETKDLAEIDIARVRIGQSVIVKLDAFPGEEFHAQVSAIDPVGREYLGDMTYQVTVTLDEPDPRFLWNMTATVTIETP